MKKLEIIADGAFGSCYSLDTVKVRFANPIPLKPSVFWVRLWPRRKVVLLVPQGSADAFRQAEGWKLFSEIKEY